MLVLGIDTATVVASVGLMGQSGLLAEESVPESTNHAEVLLPLIANVLAKASVTLAEVRGLGVSIGPGSFTGLRTALSTVQGFAYAMGQKVVGIPTLAALAQTVRDWEGQICTILDARKREVYAAFFHRSRQGSVKRLSPDQVITPQALLVHITTPCLFLGDGVETYGPLIQERCGPSARLLPFATHHPRGAVIATMAWARLSQGEHDDLSTLAPSYVRLAEAELKRTA
jgi:tRNA threonylcarbamoyladenosine biosynthesis protein TsaB